MSSPNSKRTNVSATMRLCQGITRLIIGPEIGPPKLTRDPQFEERVSGT